MPEVERRLYLGGNVSHDDRIAVVHEDDLHVLPIFCHFFDFGSVPFSIAFASLAVAIADSTGIPSAKEKKIQLSFSIALTKFIPHLLQTLSPPFCFSPSP